MYYLLALLYSVMGKRFDLELESGKKLTNS